MVEFTTAVFNIALMLAIPAALVMTAMTFLMMLLMGLWVFGMIVYCVNEVKDRTELFITKLFQKWNKTGDRDVNPGNPRTS